MLAQSVEDGVSPVNWEVGHDTGVGLGKIPQVEVDADGDHTGQRGGGVAGGFRGGRQLVDLVLDELWKWK